jgi:DNA-binding PadR family transcriptional regulator
VSLGIVYNSQPCTAYFVRQRIKSSPSAHWQASAGSVYPLVSRLIKSGILATSCDDDKRGRKFLTVTKKGEVSMKNWILSGAHRDMISAISDPIRNRISFIQLLEKEQQQKYLDDLISLMQAFYKQTKSQLSQCPAEKDINNHLIALGAMLTTKARLQWLQQVHQSILINNEQLTSKS